MAGFTQAQIDALTNAISSGVRQVDYGDKRVTYGSVDEMLRLRDRMIREVQNQSGSVTRPLYHPSVFIRR